MRVLKKLIAPASMGFVLSFFISLIATKGNFGHSLLRGLIFAVAFSLLFFLIDFVFNKFLDGPDAVSVSSKPSSDAGLGAKVDITLSDEELSDDGVDLKFSVGQNKVGLAQNPSDISRPSSVEKTETKSQSSAAPASVVQSVQPAATVSGSFQQSSSAASPSSPKESSSEGASFRPVPLGSETVSDSGNGKVGDLDSLPEISDFDSDLGSEKSESFGDDVVNDSDFAGTNNSLYNRSKPGDEVSSGRDAATLAKAIQTILKREE